MPGYVLTRVLNFHILELLNFLANRLPAYNTAVVPHRLQARIVFRQRSALARLKPSYGAVVGGAAQPGPCSCSLQTTRLAAHRQVVRARASPPRSQTPGRAGRAGACCWCVSMVLCAALTSVLMQAARHSVALAMLGVHSYEEMMQGLLDHPWPPRSRIFDAALRYWAARA